MRRGFFRWFVMPLIQKLPLSARLVKSIHTAIALHGYLLDRYTSLFSHIVGAFQLHHAPLVAWCTLCSWCWRRRGASHQAWIELARAYAWLGRWAAVNHVVTAVAGRQHPIITHSAMGMRCIRMICVALCRR